MIPIRFQSCTMGVFGLKSWDPVRPLRLLVKATNSSRNSAALEGCDWNRVQGAQHDPSIPTGQWPNPVSSVFVPRMDVTTVEGRETGQWATDGHGQSVRVSSQWASNETRQWAASGNVQPTELKREWSTGEDRLTPSDATRQLAANRNAQPGNADRQWSAPGNAQPANESRQWAGNAQPQPTNESRQWSGNSPGNAQPQPTNESRQWSGNSPGNAQPQQANESRQFSGNARPASESRQWPGNAQPQQVNESRQFSGNAQPAGESRQFSGNAQPAGESRQFSGNAQPQQVNESRQFSGNAQPASESRQFSGNAQPAIESRQFSGNAQSASESRQWPGNAQPAGEGRQWSGNAQPQPSNESRQYSATGVGQSNHAGDQRPARENGPSTLESRQWSGRERGPSATGDQGRREDRETGHWQNPPPSNPREQPSRSDPSNSFQDSSRPKAPGSNRGPSEVAPKVEPPAASRSAWRLIAKHNYTANPNSPLGEGAELSFKQAEQLTKIGVHPEQELWWRAKNENGQQGYVPSTYMMVIEDNGTLPWLKNRVVEEEVQPAIAKPLEPYRSAYNKSASGTTVAAKYYCEICGKNFNGPQPYNAHMVSKAHRETVEAQREEFPQ